MSPATLDPELIGLAINPGRRDITLPSAEELHALRARWIRYLVTQPFQDFQTGQNSELDWVLNTYRALGLKVLVLINPETLGESPPLDNSSNWGDSDSGYIGRVSDLAQKIAAFYQNKIRAIEVFNEPDRMPVAPEDYGRLLNAAYTKIKAVSYLPVISAGICCGQDFDYLARVVQAAPQAYDFAGWHPYAQRVEDFPAADWGEGDLGESLARARQIAGKPLWLTEIGAPLNYLWPSEIPPEATQAEYLTRVFDFIGALGADTVAHAFWFTWKDYTGAFQYGLVDDAGNRRPAWYAFQALSPEAYLEVELIDVRFSPVALTVGDLLIVSLTVRNNSDHAVATQGPDPGFAYDEGDTFYTRGYPEVNGAYRVGIDFDGRSGIDHPYRWGLGSALAPGETRVLTGTIRMKNAQARSYWAGLVQEQIAWLQDQQGAQALSVSSPSSGTPRIDQVVFALTKIDQRDALSVSVTVTNTSTGTLVTQGPDPGFVYDEGDSFYTRNFAEVPGAVRIGVDFDTRSGIDHPYRWGLGSPLAPGESRVITGLVRLSTPQSQNYWVGLVREHVAWLQDRQGVQRITVGAPLQGAPKIVAVSFAPTVLVPNQPCSVSITVRNDSDQTLPTQGPDPGFVYAEDDTFFSHGFADVHGAYRVGVDFAGRAGIDHPYRWGFGAPLAPGETRVITGAFRLQRVQSKNFWAGLVQEQIAWLQDQQGTQAVTINAPGAPRLIGVTLSPGTLNPNDTLDVSITVQNNSDKTLPTQGPDPGLVYEEGESFYTRGFPDVAGAFRVGVDFDVRTGIDHPYRWGLGAPLAPGESRTIGGGIRLTHAQAQNYWAGLVDERVAWVQDREGVQAIQVAAGTPPRVVHVHDDNATYWNGEPDYWNFVNATAVDQMLARGLMALTGTTAIPDAWMRILPHYQPGQGIAIKVNFANDGAAGALDSLPQTLSAVVRGLKKIGVREEDVWVYETRLIPDYFVQGIGFPGVKFYDGGSRWPTTFSSLDPAAVVSFALPPGIPPPGAIKVADVLVYATYVINLPIFKGHVTGAGVTLGFKNHLGSTNNPSATHAYFWPGGQYARTDYSFLVDLYRNPHIRNKTVLTIAEGLFTGDRYNSPPLTMKVFGGKVPNSLFLSTDPVAIDSVMYDFLSREWDIAAGADNYLRLASNIGLGVYERGDPLGSGYTQIDYRKV